MTIDIAIWQLVVLICLIYTIGKQLGFHLSKPEMVYRQKDAAE
jgi:hypothetical protein